MMEEKKELQSLEAVQQEIAVLNRKAEAALSVGAIDDWKEIWSKIRQLMKGGPSHGRES